MNAQEGQADFVHAPVLLREVVEIFVGQPCATFLDGTVGGGGHAEALLEAGVGSGRYIGLDRDPAALRAAGARLKRFGGRVVLVHACFSQAQEELGRLGVSEVDGMLADLGVSSPQLDVAERGFSLRLDGPLDMRMDPTRGETALQFVERSSEAELARVLKTLGDVQGAGRVAAAMKRKAAEGQLRTTHQLARLVEALAPAALRRRSIHPATLVFQALRCAVNDELGELRAWLDSVPALLAPGGRAAVISFQSLEDRAVKRAFRALTSASEPLPGLPVLGRPTAEFVDVVRRGQTASELERDDNPRARCARIRAVERRVPNS